MERMKGQPVIPTSHQSISPDSWGQGPHHIGQQQLWWLSMLMIRFPLLILYPQHGSFCTGPCCLYLHFPVFTHEAYPFGEHPLCSSSRTPVVHHKHLLNPFCRRPIQRFQVFSHQFLALWRLPQHLWRDLVASEFLDGCRMLIFDGNLTM